MTEERLKEIKDSIEFQLDVCKITEQELPSILALEEKELYDEVIRIQQENERLKKELNKHIKDGIEKDQEIERLNKGLEYAKRVEKDYKTKFDKAIEYIGNGNLGIPRKTRDKFIKILKGSDKE